MQAKEPENSGKIKRERPQFGLVWGINIPTNSVRTRGKGVKGKNRGQGLKARQKKEPIPCPALFPLPAGQCALCPPKKENTLQALPF